MALNFIEKILVYKTEKKRIYFATQEKLEEKFDFLLKKIDGESMKNNLLSHVKYIDVDSFTSPPPPRKGLSLKLLFLLPGNLGSWNSVCKLILTLLEEIWTNKFESPDPPPTRRKKEIGLSLKLDFYFQAT